MTEETSAQNSGGWVRCANSWTTMYSMSAEFTIIGAPVEAQRPVGRVTPTALALVAHEHTRIPAMSEPWSPSIYNLRQPLFGARPIPVDNGPADRLESFIAAESGRRAYLEPPVIEADFRRAHICVLYNHSDVASQIRQRLAAEEALGGGFQHPIRPMTQYPASPLPHNAAQLIDWHVHRRGYQYSAAVHRDLDGLPAPTAAPHLVVDAGAGFEERRTRPGAFHLLDGSSIDVPMMNTTDELGYAKGEEYQVVDLPYLGRELSMTLMLPDKGRFREFEQGLDGCPDEAHHWGDQGTSS